MADPLDLQALKRRQRAKEEEYLALHTEEWDSNSDLRERSERLLADYKNIGEQIDAVQKFHALKALETDDETSKSKGRGVPTDGDKPNTYREQLRDCADAWFRAAHPDKPGTPEDAFRQKAQDLGLMNLTTGSSSGGDTIAEVLVPEVLKSVRNLVAMRDLGDVQTISSLGGSTGVSFITNADSSKARIIAENTAVTDQDVSFDKLTGVPDEWSTGTIPVTYATLEDSAINVDAVLREIMMERVIDGQGQGMIQGDVDAVKQTNSHTGNIIGALETASTTAGGFGLSTTYDTQFTTAANNAITVADMRGVWGKCKPQYRQPGVGTWLMPTSTYITLLELAATNADDSRILKRGGDRNEDTIFGNPIRLDDYVPASAAGARIMGIGDWRGYKVRDITQGATIQIYDGDTYKAKRAVGYEMIWRTVARPVDYYRVAILDQKS